MRFLKWFNKCKEAIQVFVMLPASTFEDEHDVDSCRQSTSYQLYECAITSLLGIVICPSVATCWGCLHPLLWRPWSNRYHCVCFVMFLPGCVPGWSCLDVQPLTFLSPGVSWAKQTKPRFWVVLGLLIRCQKGYKRVQLGKYLASVLAIPLPATL